VNTNEINRAVMLSRVRRSLGVAERAGEREPLPRIAIPRDYLPAQRTASDEDLETFAERLHAYDAVVHETDAHSVPAVVADALHARGAERIVIPDGFPDEWRPARTVGAPESVFKIASDNPELTTPQLASADAILTGAAVAIADSGTIVLDHGPGQGRRALSLIPDSMVVVLAAEQVVGNTPAAIEALDPRRPITFVSGPSATVDIELVRVRGVHGPRRLDVVLVSR
jgi:L-lactate dehydrogenase complex protein LldG